MPPLLGEFRGEAREVGQEAWIREAWLGSGGWGPARTEPTTSWDGAGEASAWVWLDGSREQQTHSRVRLGLFTAQTHLPSRAQHPQLKS